MPLLCRIKNVKSNRYVVTGDTYDGTIYHQDHNDRLNAIWAQIPDPTSDRHEFRDMKHGYQLTAGGFAIQQSDGGMVTPEVAHVFSYRDVRTLWTVTKLSNQNVTLSDAYTHRFLSATPEENTIHVRQQDAWSEWILDQVPSANLTFPVTRWEPAQLNSINYYVSLDNTGALAAQDVYNVIDTAVNRWVEVFGILIPNGISLQARRVGSPGQATLIFKWDSLTNAPQDAAADVDNTSGQSIWGKGVATPRTVIFQKGQPWLPIAGEYNLLIAAVHELGHVFGIDHSIWPKNVMAPKMSDITFGMGDKIDGYNWARLMVRYADVLY